MNVSLVGKCLLNFIVCGFLAASMVNANEAEAIAHDSIDQVAEAYVKLGLSLGQHDSLPSYYFGPSEWQVEADEKSLPLAEIAAALDRLMTRLDALPEPKNKLDKQRLKAFRGRLLAMITRVGIVQGDLPESLDEELRLMYGVKVRQRTEEEFSALINELDDIIPGEGDLSERVERFRDQFVIPVDRLEAVMGAALSECRKRTLSHIDLPENEQASLRLVTDKPWVGFLHYLGQGKSNVLLNQDVPIHLERAIELGCHEGYPGHHVHATLIENSLLQDKGWIEYSLIQLYGPQAIIAEGVASYAEELVFSKEERLNFETSTLIPLAGLDNSKLDVYNRYREIKRKLIYAWNEVARLYLYGEMEREDAIVWLKKYGLETEGTAAQRLDFINSLRAYVVSYNYGRDLVKDYVERESGGDTEEKWMLYKNLLTNPLVADDIVNR